MVRISELSDDLLLKILSFLPTKVAVSTSILSKQWQFLWMWLPKLEYNEYDFAGPMYSGWGTYRCEEFIDKNLPVHRAPVIESLLLRVCHSRLSRVEKIKRWVDIAVSRCVRELSIGNYCYNPKPSDVSSLPSSLYTCVSLMTLKLQSQNILVDVPRTVCLPSLKTLQLRHVTYSNEDSLPLLLSHCPVLDDLLIVNEDDNLRAIVVNVQSLQRLSLLIGYPSSSDEYVIVTPCLKYLRILDYRDFPSYLIEPMPKLEEADIDVTRDIEKILESITSVRRLSLRSSWFISAEESVYRSGIVFSQLEHLKLSIVTYNWSKLLIWLLRNSPKLRVLNLCVDLRYQPYQEYQPVNWKNTGSSVPECLLRSLETFEFKYYRGSQEERDFLSFIDKHARCLKSTPIIHHATEFGV